MLNSAYGVRNELKKQNTDLASTILKIYYNPKNQEEVKRIFKQHPHMKEKGKKLLTNMLPHSLAFGINADTQEVNTELVIETEMFLTELSTLSSSQTPLTEDVKMMLEALNLKTTKGLTTMKAWRKMEHNFAQNNKKDKK